MVESSGTRWFGVRAARSFRPVFFVFLFAGVFFVVPYLLLISTQVCFRAAWQKRPGYFWRGAVFLSIAVAVMVTCPASPFFVGLEGPIPLDWFSSALESGLSVWSILMSQIFFINAALIAIIVCFPMSALSTFVTIRERRRLADIARSREGGG